MAATIAERLDPPDVASCFDCYDRWRFRGVDRRACFGGRAHDTDSRRGKSLETILREVVFERLEISPKRLLIYRQLREMRRAILQRSPGDNITSIASELGIWELGRMAKRYRQVYGESPSDTLSRS